MAWLPYAKASGLADLGRRVDLVERSGLVQRLDMVAFQAAGTAALNAAPGPSRSKAARRFSAA